MKPKVITIAEFVDGLPIGANSFVISNKKDEERIKKKAEKLFSKTGQENGMAKSEAEIYLEAGYCFNGNYSLFYINS